jgi:hypothetical protein
LVFDAAAGDVMFLHSGDELVDIVTHQVEFMDVVLVRLMNGDLHGR